MWLIQDVVIRCDLPPFLRLKWYYRHSDLNHELPWVNALLLLSSFQVKHVNSAKHGVNSALERLQTLPCNLWTWRQLQSAVCERRSKPFLPNVNALLSLANTRAPVCDGMSACISPTIQIGMGLLLEVILTSLAAASGVARFGGTTVPTTAFPPNRLAMCEQVTVLSSL
jgi:hypothetical protein